MIYAHYDIKELENDLNSDISKTTIKIGETKQDLSIINKYIDNYRKEKGENGFSISDAVNAVTPYIKNAAFNEEKEVRIIFDLIEHYKGFVQYMDDDRGGFK